MQKRKRSWSLMQSALSELGQPGISQEEAVASLSEAEAELRALEEENAVPAGDLLDEAGSSLADNQNGQSLGESLQNGDFGGAAAAAADLATELENLTPEEQAELAEDLAQAAEALAEADPELAQSWLKRPRSAAKWRHRRRPGRSARRLRHPASPRPGRRRLGPGRQQRRPAQRRA